MNNEFNVRVRTSLKSHDFKYEFQDDYLVLFHLPRIGDLIEIEGDVYKVQDVLHRERTTPVIYVWAHGA